MTLTEQEQRDCLAHDPFGDDFGEPGERTLSDKIVTTRKPFRCWLCQGDFPAGTVARSRTDLCPGVGVATVRFCEECCRAQAKSWKDDGDAIDARLALRPEPINEVSP